MKRKLKVGVSACLIGRNCRYDSGNKLDSALKEFLEKEFEIVPICPEVECGMSIPREPANLLIQIRKKRFITLNYRQDFTKSLADWIENKLKDIEKGNLCGFFIFKSKSPSCALHHDAQIYDGKIEGYPSSFGFGLFAESVMNMQHSPDIIVEDETSLLTDTGKIDFLRRIKNQKSF